MATRSSSTVSTVLAPDPAAVRQAREIVRRALTRWRVDAIADDVVLVASELVSNAVLHGVDGRGLPRGKLEFDLVSTGSHLVCTVSDPSPEPPVRRDSDEDATGGRGLQLIEALSMCWGWTPGGASRGKSVWAVFPLTETGGPGLRPVALRAG
jgi:anti-sigma regulatory factor (Ser/Thr protein kinase)